jgi:hypothetical protein
MGNENSKSVERKESEIEKKDKETREDAKDLEVIRRSKRNGNIQNFAGKNRYDDYGRGVRTEHNTYLEQIPRREDESHQASVPLGFSRFHTNLIDVTLWNIVNFQGWRIAIPKLMNDVQVRYLLRRMYTDGPSSVGYAVAPGGDTLVPKKVLMTNREVLASL